jgi:hypothetical protein
LLTCSLTYTCTPSRWATTSASSFGGTLLRVVGAQPAVHQVFETTGLLDLLGWVGGRRQLFRPQASVPIEDRIDCTPAADEIGGHGTG